MAIINNPWLNTLQRSYNDIKINLLNKVNLMVQDSVNPLLTSEEDKNKRAITDTTEGNIFTLLISMFSGIAEVIHYYIDSMARETFFITARRYTSLQKHCKMLDYHIKSANPPSVNLIIQRTKEDREDLIIPVYKPNLSNNVIFKDSSGNQWVTETEYRLRGSYEKVSAKARAMVRNLSADKTTEAWDGNANNPGELKITNDPIDTELNITATFVEDEPGPELPDLVGQDLPFIVISVVQKEYVAKQSFGTINQQNTVLYVPNIPSNKYYVEGSMTLWINDEIWSLVDTFAYSGPGDKVYKIELDQNMRPYVVFSSDTLNGTVPDIGSEVFGEFYVTNGANANIAAGSITNVPSQIPNSSNYKVLQQSAASGGTNYETFGMIKQRLPLMMKSMNIGITKEDFEAIAMNVNGVAKAYVDYKCGQRFTLYISPENGILPSQSLLDSVREVINQRKALSTNYTIDFIRPEYIFVNMVVTGKKSASEEIITKQIIETLTNFYSFENADPNRLVALSDIYGMIENLKTVDFLYINSLVFIPQVKAANYTSSPQIRISNFATNYTPKPYKDLGSTLVDQSSYDVYLTLTADFENQSFEIGLDNSIYNSTGITLQTNGDLKFDQQFSIDISFNSNATMKVINQIDGGYQLSYASGKIIDDHFKCSMILTCDQLNTVGHQETNTDDPEAHHYSLVLRIPFIGSSYSPSGELGNNKYSEVKTILGQGAFEGHSLQLMDQNNITIKVNEVI